MGRKVTILDGHPEKQSSRFCHAAASSYAARGMTGPVVTPSTLIDSVESISDADRREWLARIAALGRKAR